MRTIWIAVVIMFSLFCFGNFADSGTPISMVCEGNRAIITVTPAGNRAKYVGVTATLQNGKYYDFPVEKISFF